MPTRNKEVGLLTLSHERLEEEPFGIPAPRNQSTNQDTLLPRHTRQYERRKAAGICAYFGCSAAPHSHRRYCHKHLRRMSRVNKIRIETRKSQNLCTYCGVQPQFWGTRCIVCRQKFVKDPLPAGARRALRLFRRAEQQLRTEQLQSAARFAIRKLLAAGEVKGARARALNLYAGTDNGSWRTYQEVGALMCLSKERVRQLLKPSKEILAGMLDGQVPWPSD